MSERIGHAAAAVVKIGRLVRRIKTAGAATRTAFRDRSRAATRRVREIASKLRLRGAAAPGGIASRTITSLAVLGAVLGIAYRRASTRQSGRPSQMDAVAAAA